jgi:hypothetical protein
MMMSMRVSGVLPPPRPSYPAESEVDYPVFTEDEYRALMLAEFGPLLPFLNQQDEIQATMPADDVEIQPPPLVEIEDESQPMIADENEMQACLPIPPCGDNKEGCKKRKEPPPPSTETEDAIDEPSPRSPKRAKETEELPSPRATSKIMATCILERSHSAPEPSEPKGRTVLRCQCGEFPLDAPPCAMHQRAPFRSWMGYHYQGRIPPVGSNIGVVVPTTRTEHKRLVLTYIRWRRKVWMPSRFYVEHAELEMAS